MENRNKNTSFFEKIKELLNNKPKRYLFVFLFTIPFIAILVFCGVKLYGEVKSIKDLATNSMEIKDENRVSSMEYVLREDATEYQKELFKELKEGVEETGLSDQEIANLVCKNFVADFYTWTNKQGQFDVGGMYYIYDGEFKDSSHFRENVYKNARYGFYKYLSTYIKQFGKENLLEVENVEVTKSTKGDDVVISEHVANKEDENGEWYDYREDRTFEAYYITCNWTYKAVTGKFDITHYPTTSNFVVIKDGDRFSIVACDDKEINLKIVEETEEQTEGETVEG